MCTVSWAVQYYINRTSGQCSTGLGQVSGTASGVPGNTVSGISTVSGGGPTFTVKCSPSFSYTASAVVMNLGGTTPDPKGGDDLLTGQQCSASLVGVPSSPAYPTTYAWSVSAGGGTADVFKTYNNQAAANPLVLLFGADLAASSLSFYDKNQETIVIQCKATISAADGKSSQVVTVQSQPVAVLKPALMKWTIDDPQYVSGFFMDSSHSKYGVLVVWKPVNITVPSPFSGGMGCFAQLITPSRHASRSPNPGKPADYYLKTPYTKSDGSQGWNLPVQGLDGGFPYVNYTWDISTTGTSGDQPSQTYLPADVDQGGSQWYTSATTDSFVTWLMYKPTSTNAVWVPMGKVAWSSNASVLFAGGSWQYNPDGALTTPTSGGTASDYPQWTVINNLALMQMQP